MNQKIDQSHQQEALNVVMLNCMIWLLILILAGWQEEPLSGGYQLQTLASGTNLIWGTIISSFIIGIFHVFNPGAILIHTAGIILAGLFPAFPFVLTRQLWSSTGLHISWNFPEGAVFGYSVSGLRTYRLISQISQGPELWTGSFFCPEAGLIVVPALLFG